MCSSAVASPSTLNKFYHCDTASSWAEAKEPRKHLTPAPRCTSAQAILAIRDRVLLPGGYLRLSIGSSRSVALVKVQKDTCAMLQSESVPHIPPPSTSRYPSSKHAILGPTRGLGNGVGREFVVALAHGADAAGASGHISSEDLPFHRMGCLVRVEQVTRAADAEVITLGAAECSQGAGEGGQPPRF